MRLHAVLGGSIVTIANAMLCTNWKEITLYAASQSAAEKIVAQITELANASQIQAIIKPEIVVIPELNDTASLLEMLDGFKQVLSSRPKADSNHVLFYSATTPHLIQMVKILEIQSVLVVEDGQLRIKGIHNDSWDMLSLTVEQFLLLHGLVRKDGIIYAGETEIFQEKRLSRPIEISPWGKIQFHWVKPTSSNQKKILSKTILALRNNLGGHAMENHIDDKLMSLWLKNISLPLEIGEEEE
jgi:hypothetical protein